MAARMKLLCLLVALSLSVMAGSRTSTLAAIGTPTASIPVQQTEPITAANASQIRQIGRLGRGNISDLVWSPDHRLLAVASSIGLWLYDAEAPNAAPHLLGPDSAFVVSVAFAPDGRTLAASTLQGIQLWDISSEKPAGPLFGNRSRSMAFSPDGKILAACSEKGVELWDTETRQLNGQPFGTTECSVAFSRDGKWLAWGRLPVRVWDVETRSQVMELKDNTKSMSDSATIAFSPDGTRLATTDGERIAEWETRTGRQVGVMPFAGAWRVDFDHKGVMLVTAERGDRTSSTLWLQDARQKTRLATFDLGVDGGLFGQVQFSPDGAILASHRTILGGSVMSWWDVKTMNFIYQWQGEGSSVTHFRADGSVSLLSNHTDTFTLWEMKAGKERAISQMHNVSTAAFGPDEMQLALGYKDGSIGVLDARMGNWLFRTQGLASRIDQLVFSSDGTSIAAVSNSSGSQVVILDAKTGTRQAAIQDNAQFTRSVIFSPDRALLVAQRTDGAIRLWDLQTSAPVLTLQGQANWRGTLRFNSDGSRLAYNGVALLRLWDTTTGNQLAELSKPSEDAHEVGFAEFSADGTRLVFVYQGWLQLHDAETGRQLARLKVDPSLDHGWFSPDSTRLVIAYTNRVQLWDAKTGAQLSDTTVGDSASGKVIFSPDNSFFITTGSSGTLHLWDTKPGAI